MRAAQRLGDDGVDQLQPLQVVRRQPQRLGRRRRLRGVLPQDRGTAFRRDHRIDRVLQHQDRIAAGQRDGAAGAAFADDGGDHRHRGGQARLDRARNRLGLAARFGVDAGKGAGGVDEGQHRQAKRPRHAEIMGNPAFGVRPLLGAQHHHRPPAESPEAADHRSVVGKGAIARQRRELGNEAGDIGAGLGTRRMAGDLGLLPRRQLGIGGAKLAVSLLGQTGNLVGDVHALRLGHKPQFLDLAFQLGNGFFKVQKMAHGPGV